jgi:hypothetical protein
VSSPERFEPEAVIAALNSAGARYVVVGGLAVGAHGVVRATRDLDIVPDPAPANMQVIASTLDGLGAEHPIGGQLTGEALARPVSMKLLTRAGEVHVLNRMPGTPAFADLVAEAFEVELAPGVGAPVCGLRHLRRMKRASDRPRDAVDLAELDELHGPG